MIKKRCQFTFLNFFLGVKRETLVDTEVLKTSFWAPTKRNLRRNHRVSNSLLPNDINDQSRDIRSLWTLCRANEMISNESRRRHPYLRRLFEKKCSSKAHICSFWWKTHLYNTTTKEEEKIARANAKREMQRNTRTETLFVRVIPSSFLYRSRVHHRQRSLFLLSLSRSFHFTRNKKKSKNNKNDVPGAGFGAKTPVSLSNIHDFGAFKRFKCFFGPRTMMNNINACLRGGGFYYEGLSSVGKNFNTIFGRETSEKIPTFSHKKRFE